MLEKTSPKPLHVSLLTLQVLNLLHNNKKFYLTNVSMKNKIGCILSYVTLYNYLSDVFCRRDGDHCQHSYLECI